MSMSEILKGALSCSSSKVEKALKQLSMFHSGNEQAGLCAYSLNANGKRVRPFLVLQSCLAMSGNPDYAIHAASAVEMIHTYSLIHDDLPGMDNDDLRRGKPTLHRICSTEKALFAGDRLLLESFREILKTPLSQDIVRNMLSRLTSAAGVSYLVGGQFMDIYHPPSADQTWTRRMIKGKTAAMIRVSIELGSLVAGASERELALISSIGDDTGWLFQLTDDILDVTGTREEMGKAVSKDADMGKWNPVSELGIEGARELAVKTAHAIANSLGSLRGDWSVIKELVEYLPERRK